MDLDRPVGAIDARHTVVCPLRNRLRNRATHRRLRVLKDGAAQVVKIFHVVLIKKLDHLGLEYPASRNQRTYVAQHLLGYSHVGLEHVEERLVLAPSFERLKWWNDEPFLEQFTRLCRQAAADVCHMCHGLGEANETTVGEKRGDKPDVVKVAHNPPRIVGHQHVTWHKRIGRKHLEQLARENGVGADL